MFGFGKVKKMKIAAEQGDMQALYGLGMRCLDRLENAEGLKWLEKAADQGHEAAKKEISDIRAQMEREAVEKAERKRIMLERLPKDILGKWSYYRKEGSNDAVWNTCWFNRNGTYHYSDEDGISTKIASANYTISEDEVSFVGNDDVTPCPGTRDTVIFRPGQRFTTKIQFTPAGSLAFQPPGLGRTVIFNEHNQDR